MSTKLYTTAVLLAARIDTIFREWSSPCSWRVKLSEELLTGSKTQWRSFATKKPDAFHSELLRHVNGLPELQVALCKAKKLASYSITLGETGCVFRELLKDLLASNWLVSWSEYDPRPCLGPDGTILNQLEFKVNTSCVQLVNRMVEAMKPLPGEVIKQEQQRHTTRKHKMDDRLVQAEAIFTECRQRGLTVVEAEAEAMRKTKIKLESGSLSKRVRRHAQKQAHRPAA